MNKRDTYNQGKDTGYDIAQENCSEYNLVDEDERENFITEMLDHESDVYRQFSPFEIFACAINECGDRGEGLWDAYDKGVYNGIRKLVKEQVALLRNTHE